MQQKYHLKKNLTKLSLKSTLFDFKQQIKLKKITKAIKSVLKLKIIFSLNNLNINN